MESAYTTTRAGRGEAEPATPERGRADAPAAKWRKSRRQIAGTATAKAPVMKDLALALVMLAGIALIIAALAGPAAV